MTAADPAERVRQINDALDAAVKYGIARFVGDTNEQFRLSAAFADVLEEQLDEMGKKDDVEAVEGVVYGVVVAFAPQAQNHEQMDIAGLVARALIERRRKESGATGSLA